MRYICCWMQNMHDTLMCAGVQQALARMFQQLFLIMCGFAVSCKSRQPDHTMRPCWHCRYCWYY